MQTGQNQNESISVLLSGDRGTCRRGRSADLIPWERRPVARQENPQKSGLLFTRVNEASLVSGASRGPIFLAGRAGVVHLNFGLFLFSTNGSTLVWFRSVDFRRDFAASRAFVSYLLAKISSLGVSSIPNSESGNPCQNGVLWKKFRNYGPSCHD